MRSSGTRVFHFRVATVALEMSTSDTLDRLLGRHLLGVARRVTGKRHDAVSDLDSDRVHVDVRLPLEFLEYIPLQLLVVLHLGPPPHRSVRSAHAGYERLFMAPRQ
jgi:hypothetical protein